MLPELLDQIPADQPIGKVTADGAYDTRGCHAAIHCPAVHGYMPERGRPAMPAPSFRLAATAGHGWSTGQEHRSGAQVRAETLRATRRLGKTIWRKWSGYHRRSRVETKMHCFKLLGERVMARDFDRQVAELQIRAAILNRFTALGTPQTQRVG